MYLRRLLGIIIFLIISSAYAQTREDSAIDFQSKKQLDTEEDRYDAFQFQLSVKNMHLWRGYRVTDEAMTAANLHYISKNGNFKAGLWGGVGFAGNYTEFDYYISYTYNNWSFAIWDINNYTDFPDAQIFNYNRSETSHFIDVTASYKFDAIPLQLSWSSIIQGRDTYITSSGKLRNAFTHYVETSYAIAKGNDWNLSVFAGAAFSFESETHFYGNRPGFNNFGVTYSKSITLLERYQLPVSATAMWNNLQDHGALEVVVSIF